MISDERLREAARKAEESFLASLPEPEDCEATFSPEFERKMKKLIRRTKHPVRRRIMKAVACFLLAVLVGGGGVLTLSAEARAAFVGWVSDIYHSYETWFIYHYVGESNAVIESGNYRLTWIPEGYTEQEIFELSDQTDIHYANESGLLITFGYSSNSESIKLYIEQDNAEVYHVFVSDMPADLYLDTAEGETNILTWIDSDTNTIFWIMAHMDRDDLIKMAESVKK